MSKITSFLLSHITQQNAKAPISFYLFSLPSNGFNHVPNIWHTLSGGAILKAKWDRPPYKFCIITLIKKVLYWLVLVVKTTLLTPFQFLLARLSLVKTTSLYMYPIKILFFNGIFSLHIILFLIIDPLFIKARYIEWTEKFPLWY